MFPSSIMTSDQWKVMMFWYVVLTSIGGGFLLLSIVRSGYRYMASALNPGVRASFIDDSQRAIMAMGMIALAPVLITILTGINDGFVWVFGNIVNAYANAPQADAGTLEQAAGMFEKVLAAPFNTIIMICNKLFGLKDLDTLIFNGTTNTFGSDLLKSVDTGNVFADALVNFAMVSFSIYFNAVYTVRKWVVIANIVATPIICWAWVVTSQRQVLEIWLAEIIQTIFLQSSQAFALGIFSSILIGTGKAAQKLNISWFPDQLVQIGVFIAGFAGSICVSILIFLGVRLILAGNERDRAQVIESIKKVFIGLLILGLCVLIASFLSILLSGDWGSK